MDVRKDVADLGDSEIEKLVNAVLDLKKSPSKIKNSGRFPKPENRYDDFVMMHIIGFSSRDPNASMVAHQTSTFLPWHRIYLRLLEKELQGTRPEHKDVTIPYWDWTNLKSNEKVWNKKLMGGNGREDDGRVMDGPFAYDSGNWKQYTIPDIQPTVELRPDLSRRFGVFEENGQQVRPVELPKQQHVLEALATDPYDKSPWNRQSQPSFRNILEGFYGPSLMHNIVHGWVGGRKGVNGQVTYRGTMGTGGSPNDFVFYLHHANIDRIWADWQLDEKHWNLNHKGYLPINEGPSHIRVNAPMPPWFGNSTPATAANFYSLGYKYNKYVRPNTKDREEMVMAEEEEEMVMAEESLREPLGDLNLEFIDEDTVKNLAERLKEPFPIK